MKKRLLSLFIVGLLFISCFPDTARAAAFVTWPGNRIAVNYEPTNIIVAEDGTSYVTNNSGGIMKYMPDGTLDTGWGTSGRVLETIRPISLCFDRNGNILTGNCDAPDGVIRVSAQTGASEVIIAGIVVSGIAVDAGNNIYVNSSTAISKYSSAPALVWSKPIKTTGHSNNYEMGLCLLPDGSIITTDETGGSIVKYTPLGNADSSFGAGGSLKVTSNSAGFASYGDALYVCCYGDAVIKRVSLDGKNIENIMTGTSSAILVSKGGFYFITDLLNNSIDCYIKPHLDISKDQLHCTVDPSLLASGSTGTVTLDITSASTAAYGMTAKVFNKATHLAAADITSGAATLSNGGAAILLTPSGAGWQTGVYYVEIYFTDKHGNLTVRDSLQISPEITVVNRCNITFKAQGADDIVKTVTEGSTLTDIPAVPPKKGYTGVWDVNTFTGIKADMVVNAVYTQITHTVTFLAQGVNVAVRTVTDGSMLTSIPAVPLREGFKGAWDTNAFGNITADMVVNAVYTLITHTVTFKAEGAADIIKKVYEGDTLSDVPAVPARSGYTGAWDTTKFTNIKSDIVVNAIYTKMKKDILTQGNITIDGMDEVKFDYDTQLICELITRPDDLANANANIGFADNKMELSSLYSIKLMLNGVQVQPSGQIKVKIKITADLQNFKDLQIIYLADDGTVTTLLSTIDGEYIYFFVDHLSTYGIIGTRLNSQTTLSRFYGVLVAGFFISAVLFLVIIIFVIRKRRKDRIMDDEDEDTDSDIDADVRNDAEENIDEDIKEYKKHDL